FSATLKTAGGRTLTATDIAAPTIVGTSSSITVNAAAATHLTVSAPATAVAGTSFNFSVTALDTFNNTATGYGGTVHFTSNDLAATLPANSTLTGGAGTFNPAFIFAGARTITATDTVTGSISGTTASITVNPGPTSSLQISGPTLVVAGQS